MIIKKNEIHDWREIAIRCRNLAATISGKPGSTPHTYDSKMVKELGHYAFKIEEQIKKQSK